MLVLLRIGLLVGRVLGRAGLESAGRRSPGVRLLRLGNRPWSGWFRPLWLGMWRHGSGLLRPGLLLGRIFGIRLGNVGGHKDTFQCFYASSQHICSTPGLIGDKDL